VIFLTTKTESNTVNIPFEVFSDPPGTSIGEKNIKKLLSILYLKGVFLNLASKQALESRLRSHHSIRVKA
jgi:hypothetical protein